MPSTLRRRFDYPSGDIVTGRPTIDRALDRVLRGVRRVPRPAAPSTRGDAAVFGFPRSGNTMLAAWLQAAVQPGIVIHDGRATHSALDLLRFAETGMPVVIPVRPPMDTCASFLVRHGRPEDSALGARLVEAYAAWYRMARHALGHSNAVVMPFRTTTQEPEALAAWAPIGRLLDAGAISRLRPDAFVEELRHDLAGVIGQGTSENGVPSAWLISVPDPGRSEPLSQARVALSAGSCTKAMIRAEDAFDGLMTMAQARGALITAVDADARDLPVYAQRSA